MKIAEGARLWAVVLLLALPAARGAGAAPEDGDAAVFLAGVRRTTEQLCRDPDRSVGAAGHGAAVTGLLQRVRALPGVKVWTQSFETLMPVTETATVEIHDGASAGVHPVFPVWPALVRMQTTPREGLNGKAVLVRREGDDLRWPARSLRGQVAVMDAADSKSWQRAFDLGAKAVLLLGSEGETTSTMLRHLADVPYWMPRYYVPEGPVADAFRRGAVGTVTLRCRAAWKPARATNVYALCLPADGSGGEAIALAAPLDAVSALQGMAPGADAAVDAALLLELLEHFSREPPGRPVLVAWLDAQGINQLGMRHFLGAIAALPEQRKRIEWEDEKLAERYKEHRSLVEELGEGMQALERMHASRYKPLHRYVKDLLAEEMNDLEARVPEQRLRLYEAAAEDKPRLRAELDRMTQRRNQLNALQNQFLYKRPVTEENREEALLCWQRVRERIERQSAVASRPLDYYRELDAIRGQWREALGLEDEEKLPVLFLLGLDLSDAGTACGPMLYCSHLLTDERVNADDFVRWLARVRTRNLASVWPAPLKGAVNLAPINPDEAVRTCTIGPVPTLTSPAESFGVRAATWGTVEALRTKPDTAYDRAENLDWTRLAPQVEATRRLVLGFCEKDSFTVRHRSAYQRWSRIWGAIVDQSPGDPVPKVPMPGYVTALVRSGARVVHPHVAVGVRYSEFHITGIDGRCRFEFMPANLGGTVARFAIEAFKFDGQGRIVSVVSRVEKVSGLKQSIAVGDLAEARAMVFDCVEVVNPPRLFDARALVRLQEGSLLDAISRAAPEYSHAEQTQGQLCLFVPPGTRWQFIARSGATGARHLLINERDPGHAQSDQDAADALGFDPLRPLPGVADLVAARDFWRVDEQRLRGFRKAGISSPILERLHDRAAEHLAAADAAVEADDGEELYRQAQAALANELRAYGGIRTTADDVVRAVMFLLIGLLPFSIAMERLVLASTHIYRQILGTIVIFLLMLGALWSFHPAFRITNQPLMLIMAFLIIFLSGMVTMVLMRRFESDLEKMRSGRAEESGASTARGGLISCALTIGIATMRKRKLRTALTGITVALITFALLSFSSTSKIKEFSRYELGGEAAYTGVLVQEPGKGPLNEQTVKVVRRAAGTNAVVAARRWLALSANDQQWRLHVRIPGTDRDVVMKAALALTPEDREVGGLDRWLPDWDGFVASGGCYLPPAKAEALGVKPGDSLTVAGMPYTFTGTFDPVVFRDRLRMLNGDPMMPLDYAAIEDNEQAVLQNMTLEDAARGMLTGESRTSEDFLDPAEMALVLGAEDVPGLTLHAVELREPSAEAAEATAISLAQQLDYPVFYSSGSGISVLAAAPLVPRPPRSMLIPLLVAGLIIFNTMLNSIAERRKEIHVYTSLGLAPVHIGSIFMAEALTYGLMGGMFGYVAGQGMATVFSKLGWMGDITLNYSGTQVIYTMLLVLAVVVVSALIPAAMAARLASPSKETGWHLPAPDGDRIHDVLPFTVTPQAAGGILAFLYEHFDAHREGSIGDFSCADLAFAAADDCPEGCLGTLRATVWLAPYDLGVRQDVVVRILQSDEDVCDVHLDLHRRAGQPRSWHKLNRVFVGGLRRQILGWRNISASRVLAYIAMAAGGMRERPAIPAFEGMDEDVASS